MKSPHELKFYLYILEPYWKQPRINTKRGGTSSLELKIVPTRHETPAHTFWAVAGFCFRPSRESWQSSLRRLIPEQVDLTTDAG